MQQQFNSFRLLLGIVALTVLGSIPVGGRSSLCTRLQATLRNGAPNARDYEQIEHHYYERLIDPARNRDMAAAPMDPGRLAVNVPDVREYVLKPNLRTTHKGALWTTNSLGLRDREYQTQKPAGTFRIALVGDSIASGWGVDDGTGLEPQLETRLNLRSGSQAGARIEILNFAVPGHAPGQRWEHFRRIGWQTSPDLILFESTLADLGWDERRLRALIPQGFGLDAPVYADVLKHYDFSHVNDFKNRLRPLRDQILAGVYSKAVADAHDRNIPIVWILLPRVGKLLMPADHSKLLHLASSAGFNAVIDLSGTFDGQSATSLAIAPDDFHPNLKGHTQLADRLDAILGDFVSSLITSSRPIVGVSSFVPGRSVRSLRELSLGTQPSGANSR